MIKKISYFLLLAVFGSSYGGYMEDVYRKAIELEKKEKETIKIKKEKKPTIYDKLQTKIEQLYKKHVLECAPEEIAYAETYIETAKGLPLHKKVAKVSKFERYRLLKDAELKIEIAESKIYSDIDNDGVPCYMEVAKGTNPYQPDNVVKKEIVKEKKKTSVKVKTFKPLKLHARIHFDFDKTEIKKDYLPYLNVIIRYLKRNPNIKVKIVGYTDSIGSKAYNDRLALRRAKAVKDFLVKSGIPSNRIEVEGIGKAKYLFDNKTEINRFTNRRAEFFIMEVK